MQINEYMPVYIGHGRGLHMIVQTLYRFSWSPSGQLVGVRLVTDTEFVLPSSFCISFLGFKPPRGERERCTRIGNVQLLRIIQLVVRRKERI